MNDIREDGHLRHAQPSTSKGGAAVSPAEVVPWLIGGPVVYEVKPLRDIVLIICRGWWIILIAQTFGLSAAIFVLDRAPQR